MNKKESEMSLTYKEMEKEANEVEMLDKMNNYFESRTCENCKLKDKELNNGYCRILARIPAEYKEDFGCNRWEKKNEIQ